MSDSLRPHRQQPTRLPRPWNSPGKSTGVGCHFLLQCMKVKSLSRVQLLATPWTPALQAPPPMGFSRQEYWSGAPLPSPPTTCYSILNLSLAVACFRVILLRNQLQDLGQEEATHVFFLLCVRLMTSTQRRHWHPTPVLLPGKSHGWKRLVGCSP